MLTAASSREGFPALFQLALQIVSQNRELPTELGEHLHTVVEQALDIVGDPRSIGNDTLPEAIQLALDLQKSKRLRSALSVFPGQITAESAKSILTLERKLAAAR